MKQLSRVVWSEGMYLAPQHFQTQSRYFEDSLQFTTAALWFKPYGFTALHLDHESLQNGTVKVVHARGVLPDGLPFDIPLSDPEPPPLAIKPLFSPIKDTHIVLLAIPARHASAANVDMTPNGHSRTRYVSRSETYRDENDGRDEKTVAVGKKNWQLLLDSSESSGMVTMPIARVRRTGTGQFTYDPTFVPPCLDLSASESLLLQLRGLLDALEEKSEALIGPDLRAGQSLTDYYRREVGTLWFLHTIHSALPALHHLLRRRGHPENLYLELARLAGALSSFDLDRDASNIPLYDHDRLGECFQQLDGRIRAQLNVILPTRYLTVPLQLGDRSIWVGQVSDDRCFRPSRWILAVRSRAGEAAVISRTPAVVKVCSERFVGELVRRAMPGMTLTHLPTPPAAMPSRVEYSYFSIAKSGPCWDHLRQTKSVGVYVPTDIPDPELELVIVLDE